MEASVIIPCWIIDDTLLKLTERCIQSIRETSDVELIIIDNGSPIGFEFLMEMGDVYVRNSTNLGYVKAINQGIKLASSNYIVCGNNDFQMTPGWVKALKEPLDEIEYCGIVCPHVDGTPKRDTLWVEHGTPGGWYMIKKETIAKFGLLDERFFNVFADFDFCWRMGKLGKKVLSTPFITVTHYGEASLSKFRSRQDEWAKGRNLLMEKWKNDPYMEKMLKDMGLIG